MKITNHHDQVPHRLIQKGTNLVLRISRQILEAQKMKLSQMPQKKELL